MTVDKFVGIICTVWMNNLVGYLSILRMIVAILHGGVRRPGGRTRGS